MPNRGSTEPGCCARTTSPQHLKKGCSSLPHSPVSRARCPITMRSRFYFPSQTVTLVYFSYCLCAVPPRFCSSAPSSGPAHLPLHSELLPEILLLYSWCPFAPSALLFPLLSTPTGVVSLSVRRRRCWDKGNTSQCPLCLLPPSSVMFMVSVTLGVSGGDLDLEYCNGAGSSAPVGRDGAQCLSVSSCSWS